MLKDGCDINETELSIGDVVEYLSWEKTWVVYKGVALQSRVGSSFIVAAFTDESKRYIQLKELTGEEVWGHWDSTCFEKIANG